MNDEVTLVSRILSGDAEAWAIFCNVYSPVIESSIRRYVKDAETRRDLYASLLEKLKQSKLKSFAGRCTLAGWLFAVVRNHCRDYYRSDNGVRYIMGMLKRLRPEERRFFTLYYIQGLSLHDAYESMRAETGGKVGYVEMNEYDESIRRKIAKKKLAKLTERLLRPDARYRGESGAAAESESRDLQAALLPSPENVADSMQIKETMERLHKAVQRLPHQDQLILRLRFEDRLTARKIGEILDLGNEKYVYKRLEKLLGELRRMLSESGISE